jgi:hypothetical protein
MKETYYLFDNTGTLLREFDSYQQAADHLGISVTYARKILKYEYQYKTKYLSKDINYGFKIHSRNQRAEQIKPVYVDDYKPQKVKTYAQILKDQYRKGFMSKWEVQESLSASRGSQFKREDRYNV